MKKIFSIILAVLLVTTCMALMSCKPEAGDPPVPPVTYTVTFDSRGGSQVPSQTVAENEYAQEPTAPTKAGDTFLCWYLDVQSNIYHFGITKVTQNITLKARWESDPTLYTVHYKIEDQIYISQDIGYDGYYAVKPTNPKKQGTLLCRNTPQF